MKSLSNLIKSSFVAFSQKEALVIDANKNKIIQSINSGVEMTATGPESVAEALIRDEELKGADFGGDTLMVDASVFPDLSVDIDESHEKDLETFKQEAEQIINKAHEEAEGLRAAAYEEAQQIKKSAYEEGYQQGYQEADVVIQKELSQKREELQQQQMDIEKECLAYKDEIVKQTEEKMVAILCNMISNLTGVFVEEQKNVLLYLINHAMEDMDNSKTFVIKVSSEDFMQLQERKEEIYGALNPNISIEFFEDVKLAPYQCIIETENGIVDLSLDVQMDNLITALKLMIKD